MTSLRHLFRNEIKPRLVSYISPLINLFKEGDPRRPTTTQILTKTLDFNAGLETQEQNPDSLLENKSKDLTFYDTLLNDDKIKSSIELKKRLTLSSKGDVIPASDDKQDIEIAEFCKWNFDNTFISFYDLLDNYLDAMVYGFKVGEIIWANEDVISKMGLIVPPEYKGKWICHNIKHKHSLFFDFKYDVYGNIEKLLIGKNFGQDITVEGEELKQKFLFFIYPYPKDGNYYGDSDLKEVYTQWYAKFNIFRFRNMYLEKFGMPIPEVVYDKKTTSASEIIELKNMMKNFQDSMYIVNPGSWNADAKDIIGKFKFILHEVRNGASTKQYEDAIDQIDKQIARKLLIPDKLGFSETTTGSYALGETQKDIFVKVIEDLQKKLENLVDNLMKKIVNVNYTNIKDFPTWKFDKLSEGIKQEMLKILVETGVIDKREKWIRKYVGIPELDEKEKKEIEKEKEEAIKNAPPQLSQSLFPAVSPKKFKSSIHPTNFKAIDRHYNEAEADFLKEYNRIWFDNIKYLTAQVERKKIIETKNLKELETLRIKKAELKRLFKNYYARLYVTGKIDAIEEIETRFKRAKKEGFKINDLIQLQVEEYLDKEWIESILKKYEELGQLTSYDSEGFKLVRNKAYINAGLTQEEMLKTVSTVTYEGIRNNKTVKDIIQNIEAYLVEQDKRYALTVARTGASDFYNTGRMNLFNSDQVSPMLEAFQYTAVLDNATTLFCESHDGQIIKKSDPEFSYINPPNHFNCRSLFGAIFIGESEQKSSFYYDYENNPQMKKWGTRVPVDARQPARGFGG